MSHRPLDPKTAVVLFADLQAGIIELGVANELSRLRRAVAALAKLAHLFEGGLAIVTTAPSEGGAGVTLEIAAALGNLAHHQRNTTDAFAHEGTREAILKTRRKTLPVAGVATEIIGQHSCLLGVAHRLQVQLVVDARGGLSQRTEDAALRRLVQASIVPTSIASLAGPLAGDFTQARTARPSASCTRWPPADGASCRS